MSLRQRHAAAAATLREIVSPVSHAGAHLPIFPHTCEFTCETCEIFRSFSFSLCWDMLSPSFVLSMLQPIANMLFKVSLIGQR